MSNFVNSINFNDELLLSLPAQLQQYVNNAGDYNNESFLPLTSQNIGEKAKELEKILTDERKTNDEFKKFYKALKTDHTRLKKECVETKTQMANLIEENKIMQEKYKAMLEKMQQELRKKQLFIEELKNRELDEIKLEKIKEELGQQIEMPYKDIVKQLEIELQKLQQELNKSRFESNFLKSVNEHDKTEHYNHVEQLKMKNEIELSAMRKDRDCLRQKLQDTNHAELCKVKEVIRENNQFKIKIKSLLEENEELREKLEHNETHNNALSRNHSKILSDYSTKISILESEKDSLKQQIDNYHKETANLNETIASQTRKMHDLERDNTKLKLSLEECHHNSKKDISNLKLEFVKEKGEENRAKEALNNQLEDLKVKLEIETNNVEAYRKLLEEKDRDLAKQMNTINEENWSKITELTNEKIDLESRIQLLTKDFDFKLGSVQLEKDKSDDKLKAFEKQREELLRENNRLKALLVDSENVRVELEREQEKNRELYRKIHKTETELNTNTGLEQELTEINMRLKSELSFHIQEAQRSKEQVIRMKDEYENRFSDWKSQFMSEKNDVRFKCEDLQSKLNRANAKLSEVAKFHEKKKKQYQAYSRKLKMKAEALNCKLKELKLKENSDKRMVPYDEYHKLKAHLIAISERHKAFRSRVLNDANSIEQTSYVGFYKPAVPKINLNEHDDFIPTSAKYVNKASDLIYSPPDHNSSDKIIEEVNHKCNEITNRLDFLTSLQNDHLKSMGNLSSRSLKTSNEPTKLDTLGESNVLDSNKKLASSILSDSSDSLSKQFSDSDDFKKNVKASSSSSPPPPPKEVKLTKKLSSRSSSSSPEKLKSDKKTSFVSALRETTSETKVAEKQNDYEDDFDADKQSSSSDSSSV